APLVGKASAGGVPPPTAGVSPDGRGAPATVSAAAATAERKTAKIAIHPPFPPSCRAGPAAHPASSRRGGSGPRAGGWEGRRGRGGRGRLSGGSWGAPAVLLAGGGGGGAELMGRVPRGGRSDEVEATPVPGGLGGFLTGLGRRVPPRLV